MHDLDAQRLLKEISALHRKTQIFLNGQLDSIGLTAGQAPFLLITCEHGPVPQNRFCELLDMSRGTVAKMLARLEEDGYISRRASPEDARVVDVYPTEKAYAVRQTLMEHGVACVRQITANMSEVERMVFCQLMHKACESISGTG